MFIMGEVATEASFRNEKRDRGNRSAYGWAGFNKSERRLREHSLRRDTGGAVTQGRVWALGLNNNREAFTQTWPPSLCEGRQGTIYCGEGH